MPDKKPSLTIMVGVMYFSTDGGEPVICKPTIMPTEKEKQLLSARAKAERETIRTVLWEVLHEQAARQDEA